MLYLDQVVIIIWMWLIRVVSSLRLLLVALALMPVTVWSNTLDDPGRLSPKIQEENFIPLPMRQDLAEPYTKKIEEKKPTKSDAEDFSFTLYGVEINGTKAMPKEAFTKIYQPHLTKKVKFSDLQSLAHQMTEEYRKNDYLISKVVLPIQEVKGGIVYFQAVEGYVSEVNFALNDPLEKQSADPNDRKFKQRANIFDYLRKALDERPVTGNNLERCMLLINELPGLKVKGVLAPAKHGAGASQIILTTKYTGIKTTAGINNFGQPSLGRTRGNVKVAFNGLGNSISRTEASFSTAEEMRKLQAVSVHHTLFTGTGGSEIKMAGSLQRTRPGGQGLEKLKIKGNSSFIGIYYSHPLIKTRRENWQTTAGFDLQNSRQMQLGSTTYNDQLRTLSLGTTYDRRDDFAGGGINLFHVNYRQGLDFLGTSNGSALSSLPEGKAKYSLLQLHMERLQSLHGPFSIYGAMSGQYAFNKLLSSEEFDVGGAMFARGYDNNEIVGSSGLAGKLELHYTKFLEAFPATMTLYGFYDGGIIWRRAPYYKQEDIRSIGLGCRLGYQSMLNLNLLGAYPLAELPSSQDSRSMVMRFQANLKM